MLCGPRGSSCAKRSKQGAVVSRCAVKADCSATDPPLQDHCRIIQKMLSSVGEAAL